MSSIYVMTPWRVDVDEVSHRFVDAETKEEAVALVVQSIVEALCLEATEAHAVLAEAYEATPARRRQELLMSLDGLRRPGKPKTASRRRQLERQVAEDERVDAWVREQLRNAPPVDHQRLRAALRPIELAHAERLARALQDRSDRSPYSADS